MTIQQFKALSCIKQAEALWEYGVFVADRESSNNSILLYQIDGFYVETLYHKTNGSIELRCFENIDLLAPYLNNIDIAEVRKSL